MFAVLTPWTIKLPLGVQLPGRTHLAVWKEQVSQLESWLCSQLSLPCELSHHPTPPLPSWRGTGASTGQRQNPTEQGQNPTGQGQSPATTCSTPPAPGIQGLSGAIPKAEVCALQGWLQPRKHSLAPARPPQGGDESVLIAQEASGSHRFGFLKAKQGMFGQR